MIDYKEVKIIMAKIIELFNHKGGVSKITTTFHLAWKLTQKNKKVLVVDGDSQCNLTGMFLGNDCVTFLKNAVIRRNQIAHEGDYTDILAKR